MVFLHSFRVVALDNYSAGKPVDVCNIGLKCVSGTDSLTKDGTNTNASIVNIIISISNILIFIGFAIAIVFIVLQGLQMLTSNGDEKKYGQALRAIMYIVLGMIVLGFASVIVQAVINIISNA